jgi:signal transduction histidine kinase
VSAALQNAQLYRETRRQAIEMAALTEVGREILATLELDVVLERIASYARELLHGDDSALFLPEAEGQSFKALVAIGAMATQLKAATVQLGQGILGDVARRGQAEIINDVNNDPRVIQIPGTPEEEQERLLVAPLLADKQVMGLMAVWRIGPRDLFNQDDLNFLTGLARQTVIAITNARLFAEAAAARAEAEQANLAKSAFLATMSHELRTPLNAIIGFTKIVKRKGATVLPEKQTDNLEKVLVSAEHLLGLINTILDIAKIEAGHMDIAPSEFNVEKLADMCAITTQPLLKTGVELAKDIEPDLPLAYSDQDKIKQILLNLLSNAAKFTHEGQVTLRVAGRKTSPYPMAGVGSVVVFNVIDSGIGIYEEDLARIFEEFQQADNSITRQYGGTGLGLSISRKLARLLGGELTATSVPGEGSTFTLAVPLRYQEPVFVA